MAARTAKEAALRFFERPSLFRAWLRKNHARASQLWVGFYKRESGRPSITWPESVDEALCVGWIDGVRKSLGEEAYCIRFTPRRPRSRWSAVNIRRAEELKKQGRMLEGGRNAFAARVEAKYSFEQEPVALSPAVQRRFRRDADAWAFWKVQPPWYRRLTSYWVMSAKKPETRERRLGMLINRSARQERI